MELANLGVGYLLEKKDIICDGKSIEIFEIVDYVVGCIFENKNLGKRCEVLRGAYASINASYFCKNMHDDKYIFFESSLDEAIRENDMKAVFEDIRKKQITGTYRYYIMKDSKDGFVSIKDKDLISFLDKDKKKTFSEDVFESSTDISLMYNEIKKTIISQDEQIMQILTSLFKNQKLIEFNYDSDLISKLKENILVCGQTGCGKTEILKRISKLSNIPMVIEDATSLSETGYQGREISDMLKNLCLMANGDIESAEKGIIVIDEFDKLAEKSFESDTHVSREGVQRSLLKLLDGTVYYLDGKKFDTSKLTIVGLGAFSGITDGDDYHNLTTEDFTRYGIMRELMGRFSKIIKMNSLKKEDIIKILKDSNFSPLNTYRTFFKSLGVDYQVNDDFLEYVASLAISKNSGARSLKTVIDECISGALFRIFAGEYSKINLINPESENGKPYILTKRK